MEETARTKSEGDSPKRSCGVSLPVFVYSFSNISVCSFIWNKRNKIKKRDFSIKTWIFVLAKLFLESTPTAAGVQKGQIKKENRKQTGAISLLRGPLSLALVTGSIIAFFTTFSMCKHWIAEYSLCWALLNRSPTEQSAQPSLHLPFAANQKRHLTGTEGKKTNTPFSVLLRQNLVN